MCGINGIFAFHYAANPVDRVELVRTRDAMAKRGPDGAGLWMSDCRRIGLGHRRLAVIDLSDSASQPMACPHGRYFITFNGEIYNHHDLRRKLEGLGRVFRSRSDTEVLLHLFAEKGEEMVHDLRGMFAFAIWDQLARRLFLARDPYGIKPLYYADDGWTFRFASQVKALMAGGAISRDREPAGLAGFYLLGSVPEPFTTFAAVQALPAGCTMTVDDVGAHEPRRYHSIAAVYRRAEERGRTGAAGTSDERLQTVRAALLDSVRHHLVADVPVGAFLSSGIDSGALVGLMRDCGQRQIQAVTIAFEEFRDRAEDETALAGAIAGAYGADHTTRLVTSREFNRDLPLILEAMDQPSIDGINSWFAAKAAREMGLKAVLSGLGGDELFGGYPSFRQVPRWASLCAPPSRIPLAGKAFRLLAGPLAAMAGINPKAAGMFEYGGSHAGAWLLKRGLYMPWELHRLLGRDVAREGLRRLAPMAHLDDMLRPRPDTPFARVATLEASVYMRNQLLRDADWASMAHSVEVRVPLVDKVLLDKLASCSLGFAAGEGKALLARAPTRALPASVTGRVKSGFCVPMVDWLARGEAATGRAVGGARLGMLPWARNWAVRIDALQAGKHEVAGIA